MKLRRRSFGPYFGLDLTNLMDTLDIIKKKRREILRVASSYGAHNIRVFGSAVRGEDTRHSDIDFLVSMEEGRSLMDQAGLLVDLEDLLGRKVDVVTDDSIHWLVRRRILREARPL